MPAVDWFEAMEEEGELCPELAPRYRNQAEVLNAAFVINDVPTKEAIDAAHNLIETAREQNIISKLNISNDQLRALAGNCARCGCPRTMRLCVSISRQRLDVGVSAPAELLCGFKRRARPKPSASAMHKLARGSSRSSAVGHGTSPSVPRRAASARTIGTTSSRSTQPSSFSRSFSARGIEREASRSMSTASKSSAASLSAASLAERLDHGTLHLVELAVRYGHRHVLRTLVKLGANVNYPDENGTPPLLLALALGRFDCALELLRGGADVTVTDEHGITAFEIIAALHEQPETFCPRAHWPKTPSGFKTLFDAACRMYTVPLEKVDHAPIFSHVAPLWSNSDSEYIPAAANFCDYFRCKLEVLPPHHSIELRSLSPPSPSSSPSSPATSDASVSSEEAKVHSFEKGVTIDVLCKVPRFGSTHSSWHEMRALQQISTKCCPSAHALSMVAHTVMFSVPGEAAATDLALMMPAPRGKNLMLYIRQYGPLPFTQLESFAQDMARALAHVHSAGYKHNDVACENFVLMEPVDPNTGLLDAKPDDDAQQRVALYDYSLARPTEHVPPAGTGLTPWRWAAPETLKSRGTLTSQQTDVWSLGIAIWELFFGAVPFDWARSSADLLKEMDSYKFLRLPFPRAPRASVYCHEISAGLSNSPDATRMASSPGSGSGAGSPTKPPLPRASTSPSMGANSSASLISHASTLSSLSSNASSECAVLHEHKELEGTDAGDEGAGAHDAAPSSYSPPSSELAPFGSSDDIERFAQRERAAYLRLIQVIGKCCSKKPDERPTAASVVDMLFSGDENEDEVNRQHWQYPVPEYDVAVKRETMSELLGPTSYVSITCVDDEYAQSTSSRENSRSMKSDQSASRSRASTNFAGAAGGATPEPDLAPQDRYESLDAGSSEKPPTIRTLTLRSESTRPAESYEAELKRKERSVQKKEDLIRNLRVSYSKLTAEHASLKAKYEREISSKKKKVFR